AACIMAWLPCTVTNVMPRVRRFATARDGFRDVEELEIGKYALIVADQPLDEIEVPAARGELETDLVEGHHRTEPLDERARIVVRRHVERDDEPFTAWNHKRPPGARNRATIVQDRPAVRRRHPHRRRTRGK